MKKAVAILICLCLLVQCVAHLGIIGYYQLNKEYIAKNLCENKDKPELNCCGKCYLKKQLKKVDDNDNSQKKAPVKVEKSESLVFLIPTTFNLPQSELPLTASCFNPFVLNFLDTPFPSSIFHPPSVGC